MGKNWKELVKEFRFTGREQDHVLVDAPSGSMAARYNGQDGHITGFQEDWVIASINGAELRFRPDELKML